jgi:hypothetical protein
VLTGRITARLSGRRCLVVIEGETGDGTPSAPIEARTAFRLADRHVGGDVTIAFERGDRSRPIALAFLGRQKDEGEDDGVQVDVDGDRLVLTGEREIVLRCGKASLTLTADGKVLLKGAYVVSHATGTNRIRGGSVQIN